MMNRLAQNIGTGVASVGGFARRHPFQLLGLFIVAVGVATSWEVSPFLGLAVTSVVLAVVYATAHTSNPD